MDRTTPIGLYNFGVSYLQTAHSASQADKQPMFSDPIEFLCAHGLELIFKAELCRTLDIDAVRKHYGHDLLKLRTRLGQDFQSKFAFDSELENVVKYLAIGHSGPNWRNRYIVTGVRSYLTPSQIVYPLRRFDTSERLWLTNHFVKVTP